MMANASSDQGIELQKQLDETNARLQRIEQEGVPSAQNLIRDDVQSVCLLHISIAFRSHDSGERLRYSGLKPERRASAG